MKKNSKFNIELKANLGNSLKPIMEKSARVGEIVSYLLLGNKLAKSERMKILSDAQNEVDKKNILLGKKTYDLDTNHLSLNPERNLIEVVAETIKTDETINILKCIENSLKYINYKEDTEDKPSEDFLNKWRNEAKLIADETLKDIWGRILAEEINNPNTLPLRTLDQIRNFSKFEAECFDKLSAFILYGDCILNPVKDNDRLFRREELICLRDAGLITHYTPGIYTKSNWKQTTLNNKKIYYITNSTHMFFIYEKDVIEKPYIITWPLTQVAKTIYSCILINENKPLDIDHLISILLEQNKSPFESKQNNFKKIYYSNWDPIQKEITSEIEVYSIK